MMSNTKGECGVCGSPTSLPVCPRCATERTAETSSYILKQNIEQGTRTDKLQQDRISFADFSLKDD